MDLETIVIVAILSLCALTTLTHFDFTPASGQQQGLVFYQEKNGWFQKDVICWKDTPYDQNCQWFDANGQKFTPGMYVMNYSCVRFVWAWERGNECYITGAQRLGDIVYGGYIPPTKSGASS